MTTSRVFFFFMVALCVSMSSLLLNGGKVSLQLGELGSVFRVVLPAALHHFVHVVRATLRTGHPVTWQPGEKGRGQCQCAYFNETKKQGIVNKSPTNA